jgi:hypothetical protein
MGRRSPFTKTQKTDAVLAVIGGKPAASGIVDDDSLNRASVVGQSNGAPHALLT